MPCLELICMKWKGWSLQVYVHHFMSPIHKLLHFHHDSISCYDNATPCYASAMSRVCNLANAKEATESSFQKTDLLEDPLLALMSSSARHSAIVLIFLNDASRAPVVSSISAWFTRRRGEISTACLFTTPADPIRVASSRGPLGG